ncbi:MAG TPA: hypothetical protein VFC27_03280 [Anaerovoracaceae bacterium]|nr:hypothetical protein [Anaerovoracaceae bacterium]
MTRKHDVPFTTSSKEFDNEHDVINWIIDNQLARRNINEDQKAYLIGKRYQEEKKEEGRPKINNNVATVTTLPSNNSRTEQKIAEQTQVSPKTVRNDEKFANAIDKVAENVGINPQRQY